MRLLKEAQRGSPGAFDELLERHLPGVWSICLGQLGTEADALEAAARFREVLRHDVMAFTPDRAFGLQLYRTLWRTLVADLEPPRPGGIDRVPVPGRTLKPAGPNDAALVRRAMHQVAPHSRLVYLFWVVTDLDAPALADLLELPEGVVRRARNLTNAALQEALTT